MNRYKAFFQTLSSLVVIAGVVYVGGTVWSSSKSPKRKPLRINNRTSSFEILSAEKHDGHIKLSFRNRSDKGIVTYVLSATTYTGTVFGFTQDYTESESGSGIAPGSDNEIILPVADSSLNDERSSSLDLLAVFFDDRSSEGEPKAIQEIEDKRLGKKVQLMQAIPLFEKMLALPDTEMSIYFYGDFKHDLMTAMAASEKRMLARMRKERPQIMSQLETDELPDDIQLGLHHGKETVLLEIRDLENMLKTQNTILREDLIRAKQTYEKIIGRL